MKRALLLLAACRSHATPEAPHGPEVQVLVTAPGLTAEQLEQRAVIPIERQRSPEITRHVRSFAVDGHAVITFELADRVETFAGRDAVTTWIEAADVRDPITAALSPITQRDGAVARYTLRSDQTSIADLRLWQQWTAERELLRVPGVAAAATCGGRDRRIEVDVDSTRALALANAHTGADVADAISRALTDGHIVFGGAQITADDLGMVVLAARPDGVVRVRDIAQVRLGDSLPDCLAVDEHGQVVAGVVFARTGSKPIDVRHAIEPTLTSLGSTAPAGTQLGLLPVERPITLAVASTARGADLRELVALRDLIKPVAGVDRMIVQRGIDYGFVAGFGDEIAIRIVPAKDVDRSDLDTAVRAAIAARGHIAFGDDARVVELLGGSLDDLAATTAALSTHSAIHIVGSIGAESSALPSPPQDHEIEGGRLGETAIPIIVLGEEMPTSTRRPPERGLVVRDDGTRWVGVRVIADDDELANAVAKLQLPAGVEVRVVRGR